MDRTAVAAVLAQPIAQQLLASSTPARLAYTGLDGDPRVVPIGFHCSGTSLVFATVPHSAKVAALARHRRVALTIDTAGMPPRALMVRGTARMELVDGVPDAFVEGGRKLVGPDAFPAWEAGVRGLYDQMVLVTVDLHWATLLDFETTIPQAVADLVAAKTSG